MRIAVRIGHAQHLAVGPQKGEIDAPCVDTDRLDLDILFRGGDHAGLPDARTANRYSSKNVRPVRESGSGSGSAPSSGACPRSAFRGSCGRWWLPDRTRETNIASSVYRFGFKLFVFCSSPRKTAGCCYPPGKRPGEAAIYASSPAPLLVRRRPGGCTYLSLRFALTNLIERIRTVCENNDIKNMFFDTVLFTDRPPHPPDANDEPSVT